MTKLAEIARAMEATAIHDADQNLIVDWDQAARAALEAMKELTPAMEGAMDAAVKFTEDNIDHYLGNLPEPIWRAGIDAILSEEPKT